MMLVLWSSIVSLLYAIVALAAPDAANVLVVGFIALLVIPATIHLVKDP